MQAEIENSKSNEVNLNVSEDISVLYIVQHELLNQKEVEFAGVVLKHQLKEDFSFRIVTKKSKPLDILHKALQSSSDNALKLKEMIELEINKEKSAGSTWNFVRIVKAEWSRELRKIFWFVPNVVSLKQKMKSNQFL